MKPNKDQFDLGQVVSNYYDADESVRNDAEASAQILKNVSIKKLDANYKKNVAKNPKDEELYATPARGGAVRRARKGEAPIFTKQSEYDKAMAADPRYTTSEDMQEMSAYYDKQAKEKK